MHTKFPLFQSHLDLAHSYWKKIVKISDLVIDATCGNGHDTVLLSRLALSEDAGQVIAIDIQKRAIEKTQDLLKAELSLKQYQRVQFIEASHETFPTSIETDSVRLIVYNLGYLPSGDKSLTTRVETTIKSLQEGLQKIIEGGALSITCYPGHNQGAIEEEAIVKWASSLNPNLWSCCHHSWLNRRQAPSLLFIQKGTIPS